MVKRWSMIEKCFFRVVVVLINNLFTINSLIFSLNELCGNVVKSVDKAYVHRLDARKHLILIY